MHLQESYFRDNVLTNTKHHRRSYSLSLFLMSLPMFEIHKTEQNNYTLYLGAFHETQDAVLFNK